MPPETLSTPRPRRVSPHRRRRRRWGGGVALGIAAVLVGVPVLLLRSSAPEPPSPADVELEAGAAFVEMALKRQAARPEGLTAEEVVALGYLERLRLGLGSPFRLADLAFHDPRLGEVARVRVATAILQWTREGRAYVPPPRALALVGIDSASRTRATALRHAALIDATVAGAADPSIGELSVRAAYTLAAAEGVVAGHAPTLAAHAAALARDRELARRDVERLVEAADRSGRHPVALLMEWRRVRRFAVEAPPGTERPPHHEVLAAPAALDLARAVGEAAVGGWALLGEAAEERPLLGETAVGRLSALAEKQDLPPSAPIRVTLDRYRADLLRDAGPARTAALRFLERGGNEERFAAEHARLAAAHDLPLLGLVAMEVAVAMRPLAQERIWYPGYPSPSTADLRRAYGLAAVEFADDVPVHWHGYYRRMLGEALADLESVLLSLDVQGLSVRFGGTGQPGTALAVHDPRTRTIRLPPGTGPGTLAHEIAHDLDWQVALARYGARGAYATDLALRRGPGDPLAAAVRDLQASPDAPPSTDEARRQWETRPTETFARMFDGYVAAVLASRGRSNGHLSSLQDQVLTAYGMAVVPEVRGWDAEALLPLLLATSALSPAEESQFRATWTPGRSPGPLRLVSEIAAAPLSIATPRTGTPLLDLDRLPPAARTRISEVERRRAEALASRAELMCENPFLHPRLAEEGAVRELIDAAAEARIRAILRRNARAQGVGLPLETLRAAWLPAADAPEGMGGRPLGALPGRSGEPCGGARASGALSGSAP